jgi:uncharacterized RDD family membrane protein YckC
VAFLIDLVIVRAAMIPFGFIFLGRFIFLGAFSGRGEIGPDQALPLVGAIAKLFVVQILFWWLYEALLTSSSKQATVGKMVFGLRVTDTNGQQISFGRASARHFSKYISGLILMVGYIIAGFTARKQALHDIIAETLVLKGRV